jgi:hypothetical protein
MLFVNICNQLGNCYLTDGRLEKALDNFELSLGMIKKVEEKIVKNGEAGSFIVKHLKNAFFISYGDGMEVHGKHSHER